VIGLCDELKVDALKVYFSTRCSSVLEYHFGAKCTSGSGLEDHHQNQLVALVVYQKQGTMPDTILGNECVGNIIVDIASLPHLRSVHGYMNK
jgi:hypothetical protein